MKNKLDGDTHFAKHRDTYDLVLKVSQNPKSNS